MTTTFLQPWAKIKTQQPGQRHRKIGVAVGIYRQLAGLKTFLPEDLFDGGGSNASNRHVFKEALQNLADRLGLEIRIAHYPPYCSKHNPIEHRLFVHVTSA